MVKTVELIDKNAEHFKNGILFGINVVLIYRRLHQSYFYLFFRSLRLEGNHFVSRIGKKYTEYNYENDPFFFIIKDLPHVIKYADNIADIEKALLCVRQIIDERLKRMQKKGLRKSQESPIYVFIDELVDLMTSTRKKDLLRILSDSASISRATNIFFVCLTQSPARVIIPAQFKLLFNCRVALRCNNAIESRQIIDDDSATKLPRYGLAIVQQDIDRYQLKINMVSDEQLQALVKSWNKQHPIITRLTRPR